MKIYFYQILIFTLTLISLQTQALTITSLNIRWFGSGGVLEGTAQDEYRESRIQEFLHLIPPSDVYVFQEVTRPELLTLLLPHLDCRTYEHRSPRHQHIVICAQPHRLLKTYVETGVQLQNQGLRPAFILHLKTPREPLSIVGVHLKAGPKHTETRLKQLRQLISSPHLTQHSVIIGDFNSFDQSRTGNKKDDLELMKEILQQKNYAHIENKKPTYIGRFTRQFDHAWTRNKRVSSLKLFGPCEEGSVNYPFNKKSFYNQFVSDHCALQITLED